VRGTSRRCVVEGGEHSVHPALTCGEPPVLDVLAVRARRHGQTEIGGIDGDVDALDAEALDDSPQLVEVEIARYRHHGVPPATPIPGHSHHQRRASTAQCADSYGATKSERHHAADKGRWSQERRPSSDVPARSSGTDRPA